MHTHEYWVKIDAVHVQPLDFIQEIQLGDGGHLTPANKWPSLSVIVRKKRRRRKEKKTYKQHSRFPPTSIPNPLTDAPAKKPWKRLDGTRTHVSSLCISPIRFSSSAFWLDTNRNSDTYPGVCRLGSKSPSSAVTTKIGKFKIKIHKVNNVIIYSKKKIHFCHTTIIQG